MTPPAKDARTHIETLWQRGSPDDLCAIDQLGHTLPYDELPGFLKHSELRLCCHLTPALAEAATELVTEEYWNAGVTREMTRQAHHASQAWIGAIDRRGTLIGTARAVSDITKFAYIFDVGVADSWRGRGIGAAVMRLLLDHPAVRRAQSVLLRTKDAMAFYERLGFKTRAAGAETTAEMRLARDVGPRPE